VYDAVLRHEAHAAGLGWTSTPGGWFELDGVPRTLIDEFSRRHHQLINRAAEDERGPAGGRTRAGAARLSRPGRTSLIDHDALRAQWRRRAAALAIELPPPWELPAGAGRTEGTTNPAMWGQPRDGSPIGGVPDADAFATRLEGVENALYADAMKQKWFAMRPDKVRSTWMLRGVLLLVALFRSSSALASAYGLAVSLTMLATTVLFYAVVRRVLRWNTVAATVLCLVRHPREAVPGRACGSLAAQQDAHVMTPLLEQRRCLSTHHQYPIMALHEFLGLPQILGAYSAALSPVAEIRQACRVLIEYPAVRQAPERGVVERRESSERSRQVGGNVVASWNRRRQGERHLVFDAPPRLRSPLLQLLVDRFRDGNH